LSKPTNKILDSKGLLRLSQWGDNTALTEPSYCLRYVTLRYVMLCTVMLRYPGRQRFVVLSRGCLYVFKDDYSSSPQYAVSLKHYARYVWV